MVIEKSTGSGLRIASTANILHELGCGQWDKSFKDMPALNKKDQQDVIDKRSGMYLCLPLNAELDPKSSVLLGVRLTFSILRTEPSVHCHHLDRKDLTVHMFGRQLQDRNFS